MRHRPLALFAAFALCALSARAQEPATATAPAATSNPAAAATPAAAPAPSGSDPREYSEASRKAYAQGLKDARKLLVERQFGDAIAILDKLSAERPREPQARFLKAVALADSGKSDEAIALFVAVLADYPEFPEPHNNLAVLYAQKGNYEQARDELEAALRAAPDYTIAYENLGDVYVRLAGVNYEKAIAREPRNRTVPPKLKLVRDVLAMRPVNAATFMGPPAPASAPAATPAAEPPK
jgi:tetratricopeptide (TPR) repeat protein